MLSLLGTRERKQHIPSRCRRQTECSPDPESS